MERYESLASSASELAEDMNSVYANFRIALESLVSTSANLYATRELLPLLSNSISFILGEKGDQRVNFLGANQHFPSFEFASGFQDVDGNITYFTSLQSTSLTTDEQVALLGYSFLIEITDTNTNQNYSFVINNDASFTSSDFPVEPTEVQIRIAHWITGRTAPLERIFTTMTPVIRVTSS